MVSGKLLVAEAVLQTTSVGNVLPTTDTATTAEAVETFCKIELSPIS